MATALVGALVLIAGCGEPGADRGEPREPSVPLHRTVAILSTGYQPAHAKILVGGTVTWINRDVGADHTAETAGGAYKRLPSGEDQSFDTHLLTYGEPYTVTFHAPGTYAYHCTFHRSMRGTVEVVERESPRR